MGTCFAVLALLQQPQPQAFLEPNDRFLQHFSGHNPSPGWPMQQKSGQQHEQLPPSRYVGFAAQFIHFIKSCSQRGSECALHNKWNGSQNMAGWGNTFFNSTLINANASCLPRGNTRMGTFGAVGLSPTSSPVTDTPTMLMVFASKSWS